jgi:hypothetical protein
MLHICWCTKKLFDKCRGIYDTISDYIYIIYIFNYIYASSDLVTMWGVRGFQPPNFFFYIG